MIWWLALFTLSAFSQDSSIERYCYTSIERMQSVRIRAKDILLPSDQVTEDQTCLVVQMREHRRELIQSYLKNLDPSVSITYSSAEIKRDPCKIKVEKIRTMQNTVINGAVNQLPQISETNTVGESKDTMQITTIKEFELKVNQDVIKGSCHYITPNHYEISIEVRKDPRPTLIGAVTPSIPQDTQSFSTNLSMRSADRIEMGGLIKKLKNSSGTVSITPSAQIDSIDGADVEQVFLSID
jgi:hypothetical protein